MRTCRVCGEAKPLEEYHVVKRRYTRRECKACHNSDRVLKSAALKAEVIQAYGGACPCCGEDFPAFLTIDHINDDGGVDRAVYRQPSTFYRFLKNSGFPKDRYRLACFNCNVGRHINGGVCPHQERELRLVVIREAVS